MSNSLAINILANPINHIEVWHDCYMSDSKKTGYISTLKLPDQQRFWGLNDLQDLLQYAKRNNKQDVYLSLNAFQHGNRSSTALLQIRNVGVDIDCYKVGVTAGTAVNKLQEYIAQGSLPNPNLVIYSGRGIQLVYSIVGGASPKMAFLSQYITMQYISILKGLGADPSASDVSRVFRLPNTTNTKNSELIKADIWRNLEYSLAELYEYCTPMEKPKTRGKRKQSKVTVLPAQKGLMTLYSLHAARMGDLEKLVEVRQGDLTGHRNDFLYIYSFTVCMFTKSKQDTAYFAYEIVERIYSRTDKPMTKREIDRTIGSACDDAIAFMKAYAANNFTMKGLPRNLIKPMKNDTVIEKLAITDDEIKQMKTIISGVEKYERKVQKRREDGVRPREEYLEEAENKRWTVKQTLKQHPEMSVRKLAEHTGISKSTVARIVKELQEEK